MVVPYPAGGPTDVIARIVAERMRASLGQPIIIENVAGGSGSIGVGRVARATPDGYTLSLGTWSTHVVNGAVLALKYDVLNDFEPVASDRAQSDANDLEQKHPSKRLEGIGRLAKGKSRQGVARDAGIAGAVHLAGILFQR